MLRLYGWTRLFRQRKRLAGSRAGIESPIVFFESQLAIRYSRPETSRPPPMLCEKLHRPPMRFLPQFLRLDDDGFSEVLHDPFGGP